MKFILKSFILINILFIISCSDDKTKSKDSDIITNKDSFANFIAKRNPVKENISVIDTVRRIPLFKLKINITPSDSVISAQVVKSKNDSPKNWTPPKKSEIISIIKNFYELEGYDWNTCYGDLGYGVEGELFFENRLFRYRLDAGGWIIIYDHRTQRYFGCKERECSSNFPGNCFCNENGIIDE